MKKLSSCVFVFLNAVFAVSAYAASDQPSIQSTPNNQLAFDTAQPRGIIISGNSSKSVGALKLSLDHGPRAEVTPWVNQQRRLRALEQTAQK